MNQTEARREYELIYVLRTQAGRPGSEKIANRVNELIAIGEGNLTRVENWGRRRLAYAVQKQKYGIYYYLRYLGGGALVAELERALRLSDDVMKFQTVKVSDAGDVPEVKAEDLEFQHLEATEEEDPADSRAAGLGLDDVRPGRDYRGSRDDSDDDVDGMDDDDEGTIFPGAKDDQEDAQ